MSVNSGRAPQLTNVGPGVSFYRIEPPEGFPNCDTQAAATFRVFEDGVPPSPLQAIPQPECSDLLLSLANTLTRASYHFRRFSWLTDVLDERRRSIGGVVAGDLLARFALFEATGMLAAAKGFVEEVLFIAARRSGESASAGDRWSLDGAVKENLVATPACKYNVGEVQLLQGRRDWYERVNGYRNVLIHRGWKETPGAGYFPRDARVREASLPDINLYLVPDPSSIPRPHRATAWTYADGLRLDDLLQEAWIGLEAYAEELRTLWGLSVPPPGTVPVAEQPNVLVCEVFPAMICVHGYSYAPIFSNERSAMTFRDSCYGADSGREVVAIRSRAGPAGPWLIHFPAGEVLRNPPTLATCDVVKIALDPVFNPHTASLAYTVELATVSLSILRAHQGWFTPVNLISSRLVDQEELFIIRASTTGP